MNEMEFDYRNVPADYELCFNQQCPLHEHCMHYVVAQQVSHVRPAGPAVYPWALRDGQCEMYRECVPVRMAWGFSSLYTYLPRHLRAIARQRVQNYFSNGAGPYYRYHHGERMLNPQQQQEVIAIVMRLGSTQEPLFDHYETSFDFS